MPIQYKLVTAVLAMTGCASVLITGELNPIMTVSGLAIFPGYYRYLKGMPAAPRWATGSLTTLTLFVFLFDAFVITGDMFLAVAHLTITFHALKSFDLKEPWDHLQVAFMSLLQLIIASELTRSLAFGVIFVIFLVLLVTAMVLSHFLKERALGSIPVIRPLVAISLLTLLVTTAVFVVLPRTPLRFIGKSHVRGIRTVGFSDKVEFGSFGEVKLDPTVVMRVVFPNRYSGPLYWRGLSMDTFDGSSWRNTGAGRTRVEKTGDEFRFVQYSESGQVEQRIYLEPLDSDVLFGLSRISAVRIESGSLLVESGMSLVMPGKGSRRVSYTVVSDPRGSYPGRPEGRYLQLPSGAGRIQELAASVSRGAPDDRGRALIIEDHLRRNYRYSLITEPVLPGVSPIDDFLFRTRQGFCEHYATAMTLMLRSLRIPARVVNGFYGGERNEYGDYLLVRQANAHSWVEALIEGEWVRFDPTPEVAAPTPSSLALFLDSLTMRWSRYVVGFSAQDQRGILSGIVSVFDRARWSGRVSGPSVRFIATAVALAAVVFLLLFFRSVRWQASRQSPATRGYLRLQRAMAKKGFEPKPSTTPGDIRAFGVSVGFAQEVGEFLDLYEKTRFGGAELSRGEKRKFRELLERLSKRGKRD